MVSQECNGENIKMSFCSWVAWPHRDPTHCVAQLDVLEKGSMKRLLQVQLEKTKVEENDVESINK